MSVNETWPKTGKTYGPAVSLIGWCLGAGWIVREPNGEGLGSGACVGRLVGPWDGCAGGGGGGGAWSGPAGEAAEGEAAGRLRPAQ